MVTSDGLHVLKAERNKEDKFTFLQLHPPSLTVKAFFMFATT